MRYFIITGTSRGLGESLTRKLLGKENGLFCISRTPNAELVKLSADLQTFLKYYEFDLLNTFQIEQLVKEIFTKIDKNEAVGIYLINNAGTLHPVKSVEESDINTINENIQLNLVAPIILSSLFIKNTNNCRAEKLIVNISSKASHLPRKNWACYNSSKAGIDSLTKTIALEQKKKRNPVKIVSLHPPAMDTGMRKEHIKARGIIKRVLDFFIHIFKEREQVYHPDVVAEKIIDLILNKNLESGQIIDLERHL